MNSPFSPYLVPEYRNSEGRLITLSEDTLARIDHLLHQGYQGVITDFPVDPVISHDAQSSFEIPLKQTGYYHWQIIHEQGDDLAQGESLGLGKLTLPPLPMGYHRLLIHDHRQQWEALLIITLPYCYALSQNDKTHRYWGVNLQLYSLRSHRNWGIGDFADLQQLIPFIAEQGGHFIGVNPLHALFLSQPESASPYQPASRYGLNPLYIAPDAIEEWYQSSSAQQWWHSKHTQQQVTQLRENDWVDYTQVTQLKLQGLSLVYDHFAALPSDHPRQCAFSDFKHHCDPRIFQLVDFELRCQTEHDECPAPLTHDFLLWLQWLAQTQLNACQQLCHNHNMLIGLYGDVAIGAGQHSAEVSANSSLFCLQASIGAPPDPLGPIGQVWGLPPIYPQQWMNQRFSSFIALLAQSMSHYGALRLDHIMALQRLWWVPEGEQATQGAYVLYPTDILLAILALESHRQHCLIIGENLGLQPDGFYEKIQQHAIFTYHVLYFQKQQSHFLPASTYPSQGFISATTHDLPTLAGFWAEKDLELWQQLGIGSADSLKQQHQQRLSDKQALLDLLIAEHQLKPEHANLNQFTSELNQAIHEYLATTAGQLLAIQLDDLLSITLPVNIPGTVTQYPNWRRKVNKSCDEICHDPMIKQLLQRVNQARTSCFNE